MVNKPIYLAASLLAILSVVAIGASANNDVFAQSDKVQATIVPGASLWPIRHSVQILL